jgi:hypothetical protein
VSGRDANDIVAIQQVWAAYAQYLDAGDPQGVASLFVPGGGYVLLYHDTSTTPDTVQPMGYSPNSAPNGQGGTVGGGCTALGSTAIVNFLTAIGDAKHNVWPPGESGGMGGHQIVDMWITVSPDGKTAIGHSYWPGGEYDNSFVKTSEGWKEDLNRVIFSTNNPTFACAN